MSAGRIFISTISIVVTVVAIILFVTGRMASWFQGSIITIHVPVAGMAESMKGYGTLIAEKRGSQVLGHLYGPKDKPYPCPVVITGVMSLASEDPLRVDVHWTYIEARWSDGSCTGETIDLHGEEIRYQSLAPADAGVFTWYGRHFGKITLEKSRSSVCGESPE